MSKKFIFDVRDIISKAETKDYFEVEGLASTNHKDLEDEIIEQNFDLSAIKAGKGVLNADHGHKYPNKDHARMGVIDDAKITPKGLWIKGKVWKNHPEALIYQNELKYKPGMVSFSVEGYTQERDSRDSKRVKRAFVTGVALTRDPVNPYTFAQLAKSLTKGENQNEEANPKNLIKSYEVNAERNPQNPQEVIEVRITKVLDPSHEDFAELYANEMHLLTKGGPGSGKKPTGRSAVSQPSHAGPSKEAPIKEKEVKVVTKEEKPEVNQSNQKREELKRELEEAHSSAHSSSEARANIAAIKERRAMNSKKRKLLNVKIKKSVFKDELLRRANSNSEFKKSLEKILTKSLSTGGAAYATTLPGDMSNGQVFQQESLNSQKQCSKCKDNKNCKCKK